jgi:hypothetical protein
MFIILSVALEPAARLEFDKECAATVHYLKIRDAAYLPHAGR